ncbi:hypothetical protein QAD02_010133 [Eretmocerus hayati]|uniref:Uncharacterized protein n=1 Tax=Eretmocerus hayati TaxID=131215 RepID=A0ACC2NBC2_9HYME|nr:hypothetical protein QAD02_010133 [Eretmocerus hayati]
MKCLVALLLVTIAVAMAEQSLVTQEEWEAYKTQHGKVYEGEEDECRKKLYSHTKKAIETHNNGGHDYKQEINKFADQLPSERPLGLLKPGETVPKPDTNLSICDKIKKHIGEA